jgi:hypothetical protein
MSDPMSDPRKLADTVREARQFAAGVLRDRADRFDETGNPETAAMLRQAASDLEEHDALVALAEEPKSWREDRWRVSAELFRSERDDRDRELGWLRSKVERERAARESAERERDDVLRGQLETGAER